ncbi:MAG: hypothetical protein ACLFVQ_00785 [Chitinispirillaceae bacterium]
MKIAVRFFSCIVMLAISASAQNVLNLFGDVGYGFGMGSYYVGSSNSVDDGARKTEDHFLNLGHGGKLELGLGYMAAENVETRFSVDLSFGFPTPDINSTLSNSTEAYDTTSDYSYFSWGIKVLVTPHFEILELLEVYVGTGLGLNFATSSYEQSVAVTVANETSRYEATFKNETPAALGFIGVAGFTLPLSDFLEVFGEARFEPMNFKLKEVSVENAEGYEEDSAPDPAYYEENVVDRLPPPNIPGTNWGLRAGLKLWLF